MGLVELHNKMKKELVIISVIILLSATLLTIDVNAIGEVSYCCEKAQSGAWCQSSPPAICDTSVNPNTGEQYKSLPTSCDATAFCKLGTCIDAEQGECRPNVPKQLCTSQGGDWHEEAPLDLVQCQPGCCLLGEDAVFVNADRCSKLAADYNLDMDFRTDVGDIFACDAMARPKAKGACVFDDGLKRNCISSTKEECYDETIASSGIDVEFHEGYLCSAPSLSTVCGKDADRTTCVEGKHEVYFKDTCGNLANIYDSSKANNDDYWTYIKLKSESCVLDYNLGNVDNCGNCVYQNFGSVCKSYQRGDEQTPRAPTAGDFVCADLNCKYDGEEYRHGESWCVTSTTSGTDENVPGSESYRLRCDYGEVLPELCGPFRTKVCIPEYEDEPFRTASCAINRWQDCVAQDNAQDCGNEDHRDCLWLVGESVLAAENGKPLVNNKDDELIRKKDTTLDLWKGASCVPKYPIGYEFWTSEGESDEICSIANQDCLIRETKKLLGKWKVDQGDECLKDKWEEQRNNLCVSLGDCGSSTNYVGTDGYSSVDAVIIGKVDK